MRAAAFEWTAERVARLRALYASPNASAESAATALGCAVRTVVLKASRLGLGAERREARHAVAKRPARRVISGRTDGELIAAAIAAGRVRVLPAGIAAGLSGWERAMGYTAPAGQVEFNGGRHGGPASADAAARRCA